MTEKILLLNYTNTKTRIKNACPYGMEFFCDGTINVQETVFRKRKRVKGKGPCEYFKNGKCTKENCRI